MNNNITINAKFGGDFDKSLYTPYIVIKFNAVWQERSIQSISISTNPKKLNYIKNQEELDLNGGKLKIIYTDNTSRIIVLNNNIRL